MEQPEDIKITREALTTLKVAFEQLKPLFALLDEEAKTCAFCNNAFLPREAKQLYCSKRCQQRASNAARPKKSDRPVVMPPIGKEVMCAVTGCENRFIFDTKVEKPYWCRTCYAMQAPQNG